MQAPHIGLAMTVEDCSVIGDISYQVNHNLHWNRTINPAVAPCDLKERMSAVAANVWRRHHGLAVVARLQERIVGYILAWEQAQGGAVDPYEQSNVKTELPGRNVLNWQSLCEEIDNVCEHVEAERGPLLYIDEVAVLPEYQQKGIGRRMVEFLIQAAKDFNLATIVLTSIPEAVPFYEEKLGFERLGSPLYFGINEKSELVPMWLRLS